MGLFDNPDSGGLGAGQVISSGLQGLVEAYKMKLQQAQEESKIRQSGFNSAMDANTAMAKLKQDKDLFNQPPTFKEIPYVGADGKPTTLVVGYKGDHIISLTPKGGTASAADAKKEKMLDAVAAAYESMDQALGMAKGFAPKENDPNAIFPGAVRAIAKSPYSYLRSKLAQTSPENNLRDKNKEAATLVATAINVGGGGRMTETEVDNTANSLGGNGIGDTFENIAMKHVQVKDNLAAKHGFTRGEVEDHLAGLHAKQAGRIKLPPPVAGAMGGGNTTPPPADGLVRVVNKSTGKTVKIRKSDFDSDSGQTYSLAQ